MPRNQERGAEADERERKQGMPGSGSDRAWRRPPSWSRSPLLHEWIRSGGILIAAAWGVYTFIYKGFECGLRMFQPFPVYYPT